MRTLSPETKRYIIIGLSVYALELLIIGLALHFGASSTVAVAISFWIGLAVSFVLQKFITFGDHRMHHKVVLMQVLAYAALVATNFSFTVGLTALLAPPLPAAVVRTVALGVTTLWNFALYKTKIFKNA